MGDKSKQTDSKGLDVCGFQTTVLQSSYSIRSPDYFVFFMNILFVIMCICVGISKHECEHGVL